MGYTLGAPEVRWEVRLGGDHLARGAQKKIELGEDLVLVDVLAEMYYRHSYLPGAINVPAEGRYYERRR